MIPDFNILCEKILEIDKDIRSARVISGMGRLIAGGMREGIESLEGSKNDELLFMNLALEVKLRHDFDDEFGAVDFVVFHREKIIIMSFPFDENVLYVSAEKQIDFKKTPLEILKILDK
ncbi:MAG: DUF6659 family protein [Nitrosotalea sp.]